MMSEYGCNIKNTNTAIERAKGKKDGFYTLKGMGYRVKNGKVTHIADVDSGVLERFGNFNVKICDLKIDIAKSEGLLLKETFKMLEAN